MDNLKNIITFPLILCITFCTIVFIAEKGGIPVLYLMTAFAAAGSVTGLTYFYMARDRKYTIVILIFTFLTCLFIIRLFYIYTHYNQVASKIEQIDRFIGYVDSFPAEKEGSLSFAFVVTGIREKNSPVFKYLSPFRISVLIKEYGSFSPARGDCLKIELPILPPREKWGSFLYRKYLFYRSTYGVIRTSGTSGIKQIEKISPPLFTAVCKGSLWKIRTFMLLRLKESLLPETNAFIGSIFFGLRGQMDKRTLNEFSSSGMMHLLAISGLHVGFLGMIILWLGKLIIPKGAAYGICIVVLFFYILIITPSASSFRAYLMLAVTGVYFILGIRSVTLTHLALSGIILLVINPFYLFDLGFQLSFLATAGIILFVDPVKSLLPEKMPRFFQDGFSVTCSAFFSLFTLQWSYFAQMPLFALISSVFVVPLFGFLFGWYFICSAIIIITGWQAAAVMLDMTIKLFLFLIKLLASVPVCKLPPLAPQMGLVSFAALFIGFYILPPLTRYLMRPVKIKLAFMLYERRVSTRPGCPS